MKLQQKIYNKFSIVAAMIMVFIALLAVAVAHGNLVFTDRFAHIVSIDQDSSNKTVLNKTDFLKNSNAADSDLDKVGTGTLVLCDSPTFTGGVSVAVGDLNSDALSFNRIHVSKISLLTSTFDGGVGVVDSCDADASSKIKMLFDVRRNLGLTNNVAIEMRKSNTPESFEALNYLRRAQASGTKIPAMKLIVADGRNQQGYLSIELKEAYITSYQTGGGAAADSGDDAPEETVQFVYGAMNVNYDRRTN